MSFAGSTVDPALRRLLDEHWNATMERSPVWATILGDHRFDDRLPDDSLPAVAAWRARQRAWSASLRAMTSLSPDDALTRDLLAEELDGDLGTEVCSFELWDLSPRDNALTRINDLAEHHEIHSPQDARNLLARYRAIPAWIDQDVANHREGLSHGLTAPRRSAELTLEQLDAELAKSDADLSAAAPWKDRPDWSDADRKILADGTASIAAIREALGRSRAFLADELIPAARPDGSEGISALPHGRECYRAMIRRHTSLSLSPAEIHEIGLDELTAIHQGFRDLGPKVLGTSADLAEIFAALRDRPDLRFSSADAVEAKAAASLARAQAAVPRYFGRLPKATCTVERVPDYSAPYTTIAYYYQPATDGSRPGTYFVNTSAPETRPIAEAEVLAFHESVPGHHLQIAIAQELTDLPMFRRQLGCTAYVEGWALYTERLADEMGLYSSDLDRLGMLSFDAWRASRLVVDTGLHDLGWTRGQAEKFLLENTPLAENNIANEVDRYITTPGQALAYKLGQREILSLRHEAETRLGPAFSLPAFHDAVLSQGAVTLPALRTHVEAWIASVPTR